MSEEWKDGGKLLVAEDCGDALKQLNENKLGLSEDTIDAAKDTLRLGAVIHRAKEWETAAQELSQNAYVCGLFGRLRALEHERISRRVNCLYESFTETIEELKIVHGFVVRDKVRRGELTLADLEARALPDAAELIVSVPPAEDNLSLDYEIARLRGIIEECSVRVWVVDDLDTFVSRTFDSKSGGRRSTYARRVMNAFAALAKETNTRGIIIQPEEENTTA